MSTNAVFYQRGESDLGGLGSLVVIGLIGWGIWSIGAPFFGGEREGSVKYDDCREIVYLKPDTLQKYYKTFTCIYNKANNGTVLSSSCVHVENDSTLLSSSHTCKTAYIYSFQLEKNGGGCLDKANPYLGYDDMCHAEPQ